MSDTDLLSSDITGAAPSGDRPDADRPAEQGAPTSAEQPGEATASNGVPARRRGGLSGMVLAELREMAGQLGISDTAGLRKGDLIAAIKERQGLASGPRRGGGGGDQLPLEEATPSAAPDATAPVVEQAPVAEPRRQETGQPDAGPGGRGNEESGRSQPGREQDGADRSRGRRRRSGGRAEGETDTDRGGRGGDQRGGQNLDRGGQNNRGQHQGGNQSQANQSQANQSQANQSQANQSNGPREDDEDDGGRRRGRRFRDRNRRGRSDRGDRNDRRDVGDLEVHEDDVLLPVAGILDVLDNYAFVRTSGYLSGPNDVYVSLSLVRRHGLRRGDAITGMVRQPRDGEQQRQKFNPLVRVDSINGLEPEAARNRPEFTKLTPLYPNDRLRLETEQHLLTTRVIDLVMPIGKGQRALIVSPPKAGKTMVLQAIANAITTNNPECHLMVVLVDERPEEVTDMQRSVKGEVIASTFDRPPSDHTAVSELAIERAKRLVEMGHDVVVLLDSITRLGRAYNLAAPASGRILSGGVDSTALYPPKRFLGAARNIEDGGSLTIFATALVETGSTMDTVIFEEFKGTGNAELKLDRKIADKRIFPAIDVNPSSTRKEELLLAPDELAINVKLRQVLSGLDSQQAINLLLDKLRKTRTNVEFLMQIQKTTLNND